jgi:hypothetical protein
MLFLIAMTKFEEILLKMHVLLTCYLKSETCYTLSSSFRILQLFKITIGYVGSICEITSQLDMWDLYVR